MLDLSKEQAVRWVVREESRLVAYDEIMERIEAERLIMEQNSGVNAVRFPMTALARQNLIARLEARLEAMRRLLH